MSGAEFSRPMPMGAARRLSSNPEANEAMNAKLRAALADTAPDRRAERTQAARDARGRFARDQADAAGGAEAKRPTMNDLIRAQLEDGTSTGGTLEWGHLSGGPAPDEAA